MDGAAGAPAFSVSIVGSTDPETEAPVGIATDSIGTFAVIGEHADITYSATASGSPATPDAVIWSAENPVGDDKSGATATFGTGLSPTDITDADEGTLYLHAQKDSVWYTQSVAVRYPVGTLPAFSSQSFSEGVEGTYTHPAATGTGLTWTYAQVGAITGVTYVAGTRTFTFADTLAVQTGTSFGASATDQYGRAALGSPRTSTFSITDFVPANITGLVVTGLQGSDGVLPVSYTIDVTTDDVAWGIGTGSTPTASDLRAGTGMTDFGTVTLTAGTNSFEETLATGIDESSLNLWMVTPGSSTVVTATASLPGVVPFAIDTTAPTISTLSPADNATDVSTIADLVMTFSEAMKQQGTVTLKNVGGATIETFDLSTDGAWTSGDTVWTGNPTSNFVSEATLAVQWSGLEDTKGNALANNATDTAWNFTVEASASYTPVFVDTNGSAYHSFDFNQIPNNAKLTFVARIADIAASGTEHLWSSQSRCTISAVNGALNIVIDDSAATNVYAAVSSSAILSGADTKTVYIAVDLAVPSIAIEVNGVAPTMTVSTSIIAGNGLIGTARNSGVLARSDGLERLNGNVSEFFMEAGAIRDPNLFYDGDHLSMDGIGSPQIYIGGGMTADEFGGNASQGWNDSYNRGSATVTTGSATYTDVV